MPRSDREIFDDHVIVLVRRLGVDLDDLADGRRRNLLQEARQRRPNEHEAALSVAYGYLDTLLESDVEHARVLADRLALTAETWDDQKLVDASRFVELDRRVRRELRAAGAG